MERSPHKKRKTQSLDPIPTDLVIEMLKRLPAKSLARLILVSKSWETIIRGRDFIRSFPFRSSSSCVLIAYNQNDYRNGRHNWFFFTSSGTNQTVPDFLYRKSFEVTGFQWCNDDTHLYVHGLMCFVYGEDHVITNPSIGKSITLPRLKTRREVVKRFFGYDPVDNHHKVLCIAKVMYGSGTRVAPCGHQVLTLGSSPKWRNIECSNPHRPITNGVCIEGVLYYFAYMGKNLKDELILVKFDVRFEKLSFFPSTIPNGLDRPWFHSYLVNYMGKVAIPNPTSRYTFDLWVLEDAEKNEWSKICLSIHPWDNMYGGHSIRVTGTAHTGEIILTYYAVNGHFHVIYHDHKKNSQRKIEIKGNDANHNITEFGSPPLCFADHIESLMLL